ncbi:MAG: TolC family protein [Phycisphaeraceae bacterium]
MPVRAGLLVTVLMLCLVAACAPDALYQYDREAYAQAVDRAERAEDEPVESPTPIEPEPPLHVALPAAGEPLALSLEQAVMLALSRNRELAVQQYQPLIAGEFEALERALYDPFIDAELAYTRERAERVNPALPGTTFESVEEGVTFDAGLRQRLLTGTEVGLELGHFTRVTDRTPRQHGTRVGVGVTQALLQGRSRLGNLAGIEQARLDAEISQYELRGFAEALVAQVEQTYWDHALAQREIEIFEASLAVARQQAQQTQQRIEVGLVPETELYAARAEVALRREELIDARSRRDQTRLRLLRLLGVGREAGWATPIELADEPTVPEVVVDEVEAHAALARQWRADLNEARLRLARDRLDVVETREGLLPRLDLFLTLGKTGYADAFGDTFHEMDGPGYDVTVGLRFEQALGRRGERAAYRQARFARSQAREAVANATELVELDVRQALVELERAGEQIDATQATRELFEQTLRAERERFEVGTSTALLVAQAQRDLLESQIAEVRAVVAFRQAVVDLYRLEGSLLHRRGIVAPGDEPVGL